MKKIAIIPARSGSKGLVDKNILILLDKPLLAYTIIAALESGVFERVIVSTDSEKYKSIAESFGAEVILRGTQYSNDIASTYMVIEHALSKLNESYDYFALLQPTSPFRSATHIKEAVDNFEKRKEFDFLVSMTESSVQSSLIKPIDDDLSLKHYNLDYSNYRRQNCIEYNPNGAIFLGKVAPYLQQKHFFGASTLAYIMDKQSSVDIDDRLDFELAITIANKANKEKDLKDNIISRINEKKRNMLSSVANITFIGHSLFDNWNVSHLLNAPVDNFGIAGINTNQYIDLILDKGIIGHVGNHTFIFAGTNDIVSSDWTIEENIKKIQELIDKVILINKKTKVYLFSVPPVRGRIDRNNVLIRELNLAIKENVSNCIFIDITSDFSDEYGELKSHFTYDGLHFTEKAYDKLENIIEKLIK